MMRAMNRTKLLIWVIIILIAVNLATIVSGIIFSAKRRNSERVPTEVPFNRRVNFFYRELRLTPDQRNRFIEFNRDFNRSARVIAGKMNSLRYRLIKELAREEINRPELDNICSEIGVLHSELKSATVDYYLKMKEICDTQQQEALNRIFQKMLDSDINNFMGRPGFNRPNRRMGPGRPFELQPMFN
jgi:hypothetical protein